jgi:hypothetical protein
MKILLDLKKHCIETEIKKLYNRSLSLYFKTNSNKKIVEQQIGLLKKALEELDFSRLRSDYPELSGSGESVVELSNDSRNQLYITIDGKKIDCG